MKPAGFICGILLGVAAVIWYMTADRSERPRVPVEQAANIVSGSSDVTSGSEYEEEPVDIPPGVPIGPPTGNETLPAAVATDQHPFPAPEQNTMALPGERPDPSWQVIWKPFRVESSALGFAKRLRSVTGLDIEVQQQTPGNYVVAFPYDDEEQRLRNIEQIENLTGLVLILGDR